MTTELTVRRYAAATAACELIPVPLLDAYAQNQVRRMALRKVANARGLALDEEELRRLADEDLGGIKEIAIRLALWPMKKLLKTVFVAIAVNNAITVARDVQARADALVDEPTRSDAPRQAA